MAGSWPEPTPEADPPMSASRRGSCARKPCASASPQVQHEPYVFTAVSRSSRTRAGLAVVLAYNGFSVSHTGSPRNPARSPSERAGQAVLLAACLVLMFSAAGTLYWLTGWAFLTVVVLGLFLHRAYVAARNAAVLERRDRIGAGTKPWDLAWLLVFWPLMLAAPVVAGLDTVRLGHRPLAVWLVPQGAFFFACGMRLSALAMVANPYSEGTARIQPDQRVVDAGPYKRVRHPGYAGLALWALAGPLLLRSAWAFVPGVFAVAWVVVRTALEDRMLRRELAGYPDYARRVRWRLVPGIW